MGSSYMAESMVIQVFTLTLTFEWSKWWIYNMHQQHYIKCIHITLSGDGCPNLSRPSVDTTKWSLWVPPTLQNTWLYQVLTLTLTFEWSKWWILNMHQPQYISFSRPLTDTPEWSLWVPSTWQNVKDLAALLFMTVIVTFSNISPIISIGTESYIYLI